jgi:hypothetical protein
MYTQLHVIYHRNHSQSSSEQGQELQEGEGQMRRFLNLLDPCPGPHLVVSSLLWFGEEDYLISLPGPMHKWFFLFPIRIDVNVRRSCCTGNMKVE